MVCLVFLIPIVYPGTAVVSCLSNDVANAAKTRTARPVKTAKIEYALLQDLMGGHVFLTQTAHLVTVAEYGHSRDAANAV